MHIDSYGRTWRYAPAHNLERALKISRDIANFGVNADLRMHFSGHRPEKLLTDDIEPYLLKVADGWSLVLRTDDNPMAYYELDDFDQRVAGLMIDMHRREIPNAGEARAFDELVEDVAEAVVNNNITEITRSSDQTLQLRFTSTRACNAFHRSLTSQPCLSS